MYDIEWIQMSRVFGYTEIKICFTTAMSIYLRFVFKAPYGKHYEFALKLRKP